MHFSMRSSSGYFPAARFPSICYRRYAEAVAAQGVDLVPKETAQPPRAVEVPDADRWNAIDDGGAGVDEGWPLWTLVDRRIRSGSVVRLGGMDSTGGGCSSPRPSSERATPWSTAIVSKRLHGDVL